MGRIPARFGPIPFLTRASHTMAQSPSSPADLLERLETRHADLLRQIDELDARVKQVLAEVTRQENGMELRK